MDFVDYDVDYSEKICITEQDAVEFFTEAEINELKETGLFAVMGGIGDAISPTIIFNIVLPIAVEIIAEMILKVFSKAFNIIKERNEKKKQGLHDPLPNLALNIEDKAGNKIYLKIETDDGDCNKLAKKAQKLLEALIEDENSDE